MIERIRITWIKWQLKKLPDEYEECLQHYSSYYRGLSPKLQNKFKLRLYISKKFIDFKPVQFDEVTEEMKILITSALIQMTFGLDKYILRTFKTIYVVPNTYSFKQYKALLGHVDYNVNIIAMSWPSVQHGFIIPHDAFNVAIHELAHAIQAENRQRLYFSKFFKDLDLLKFNHEGIKKLYEIRAKRHHYLREYAANNMIEFFAVSVETFFEQSETFKMKLPKLYGLMVELFKQDPSKETNPLQ